LQLTQNARAPFDLVLLDVSLPDGNGIKLVPKLRECFSSQFVPIIVVSGDNDIVTKVAAFGVGADDYISKPADPTELKIRIEARLRNAQLMTAERNIIEFCGVKLDNDKMSVELQTPASIEKAKLTPFEFKLLRLLLSRPDHLFTKKNPVRQRRTYEPTLALENFGLYDKDLETVFQAGNEVGMGAAKLKDIIAHLEQTYCQSIGAEYIYMREPTVLKWLQERMEKSRNTPSFSKEEKRTILKRMITLQKKIFYRMYFSMMR